jgi:hypothetical protein
MGSGGPCLSLGGDLWQMKALSRSHKQGRKNTCAQPIRAVPTNLRPPSWGPRMPAIEHPTGLPLARRTFCYAPSVTRRSAPPPVPIQVCELLFINRAACDLGAPRPEVGLMRLDPQPRRSGKSLPPLPAIAALSRGGVRRIDHSSSDVISSHRRLSAQSIPEPDRN